MELCNPPESTTSPLRVAACIGLSLLLHVGVIGLIESLQLLTRGTEPLNVVKVDLLEIQNVSHSSPAPQASSIDEPMPEMKTVTRTRMNPLHTPLQKSPSLVEIPQASLPPEVLANVRPIPLPMQKAHQTQRPPLFDQTAQNALIAKDLLKVIPHATSHTQSRPLPSERLQSLQQSLMAGIPDVALPVQRNEAMDRLIDEGHGSTPSRRSRTVNMPTAMEVPQVGNAKNPPLVDHMAQNSLKANELFKVIPRTITQRDPSPPSSELSQFLPQSLGAGIPPMASSVHKKAVKDGSVAGSRRSTSSQRILSMNMPSGDGEVGNTNAKLAQSIPPVYPRVAREEGWEGIVVLRVRLHKDGTPEHVSVQKTSGHDVLDQAALKAIYGWSFVPARDGNIPIPSLVDVPVRFDLTNG